MRAEFIAPRATYTRNDKPADFWSLAGSASLKDKQLTLTVVNADINQPREAEINVSGTRINSVNSRVLAEQDVHAHNTFDKPRNVEPKDAPVAVTNGRLVHRFAPASVTRLQITLG